ncbi:Small acid-soluble spore protein H family protein [Gracilibacillus ureilyticus]|uniref:Small acid-soluble spore protein H family protein n=1 Tax=Gracilibacillus ureilyticus TaxID=531814 RepID=A0A1H9MS77_9BACI|nr:small, acid-soluble spore protein, H family [Gracilibacillus ureilyticus]SER26451.1 Small acid-soluble spore protein H family protein [Gracilibacillus ureilyticus]
MNLMRAKDIKDDPVMKEVVHNGKYVYILDVNDETQKALVAYEKQSNDTFEVDVTELEEK